MSKIDLTYLNSIAGGDNAFIKDLLEMFRRTTPKEMTQVMGYYEANNFPMLASTAHKMKAPIEMLGQPELIANIVQLELAIKEGERDRDRIDGLLGNIKRELADLDREIENLIKTL